MGRFAAFLLLTVFLPAQTTSEWELLGSGYQLTADSAVDGDGNVYFTDARNNRILKIDLDGKIRVWKEDTHGAHGIAWGPDGRLYAGQHDRKRIVAFSSDGTETVIAEGVQTHHLTVTSRNRIYACEAPAHKVWTADATGHLRVAHEGIEWPRGVHATADGSTLAVNDAKSRWVWTFRIQPDGSLTDGRRFYQLNAKDENSVPDSGTMDFDAEGRLYVATTLGIQVCDRQGRVVSVIKGPGKGELSAVFFAGPGKRWMYVSDGDRIYRRRSVGLQ